MKWDEAALLKAMQNRGPYNKNNPNGGGRWLAQALGINHKRANGIFEKWTKKGWYDYGVSVDLGWMTPKGMAVNRP